LFNGIFHELDKYGLSVKRMIINNVVKTQESLFFRTKVRQQRPYLKQIRDKYSYLEIVELPMFPREVKGFASLREVAGILLP
jgi:anion-transporting  ArsA/GET3 family ATPase